MAAKKESQKKPSSEANFFSYLILSMAIAVGLLGAGYFVGQSRTADRFVTVKGLDERIVKADMATWQITFKTSGGVLENVLMEIEKDQANIIQFLNANGFSNDEMEFGQIKVTDKNSDQYNNQSNNAIRFIVEAKITLRTPKVDAVVRTSQKTLELAKTGVVISGDYYNSAPKFEFTGLNDLKPDMIAAATKDARNAADKFAKDAGSEVGSIRRATQGYFSVSGLNGGNSSLNKKVRVVSTIEFFLE